jgi:hypothetical protein
MKKVLKNLTIFIFFTSTFIGIGCSDHQNEIYHHNPQSNTQTTPEPISTLRTESQNSEPSPLPPPSPRLNPNLIEFYRGTGRDNMGRTLSDIRNFTFIELEQRHDYIQWLFPTIAMSQSNTNAPLLTPEIIEQFRSDPILQNQLRVSLRVFLAFLGFDIIEATDQTTETLIRSANYSDRLENWLTHTHNFLRITRILSCLRTLGLEPEARLLFGELQNVYSENQNRIGSRTFEYWQRAATNRRTSYEQ